MFKKQNNAGYEDVLDNIKRKTLVYGEKTLLTEFKLGKGAILPSHKHSHEQTGYLVSGRIDLNIGNEKYHVEPGDSWCINSNVDHSAVALENSVAIETFSPVRKDYLPKLR